MSSDSELATERLASWLDQSAVVLIHVAPMDASVTKKPAAADFFDRVARTDVMMKYMIYHRKEDPADLEDSRGFGDGFLSLLDSTADSEQGVRAMIQGVRTLKKIARDLASVGSSIEVSMNKLLQGMAVMMTWRDPLTLLFTRPVEGAADQAQPE